MKAQVAMVEMIMSVIILLIAFNIMFPGFSFKSRWDEASLLTKGRDILLTMDRTNKLLENSFDATSIQKFINKIFPLNDTLVWTETEGAIKSEIVIACNCTADQMANLSYWLNDLKFNNRTVSATICYTNLEKINPCYANPAYPDVLLIWGYKDLNAYSTELRKLLENGNGIVEIMDFSYQSQENKIDNDATQREIFGLKWVDIEKNTADYDTFSRKPSSFSDSIYFLYKYFYHLPIPLSADSSEVISDCSFNPSPKGSFNLNKTGYMFWICNATHVWFDTNGDSLKDILKAERENVAIGGYTFFLSYISSNQIGLSFRYNFQFDDFLGYIAPPGEPDPPGKAIGARRIPNIQPIDDDQNRILIKAVSTSPPREYPVAITNQTRGRVAWVADFSRNNFKNTDDSHKQLLTSLLFWASSKEAKKLTFGTKKIGYATSYLNVLNYDMFEVYRLNLGVSKPFS